MWYWNVIHSLKQIAGKMTMMESIHLKNTKYKTKYIWKKVSYYSKNELQTNNHFEIKNKNLYINLYALNRKKCVLKWSFKMLIDEQHSNKTTFNPAARKLFNFTNGKVFFFYIHIFLPAFTSPGLSCGQPVSLNF